VALPLVALQLHNVFFDLELEPLEKMYVSGPVGRLPMALTANRNSTTELTSSALKVSVYTSYVCIEQDERDRFLSRNHQYIMTQTQRVSQELNSQSTGLTAQSVNLTFQHPVYWLSWVVRTSSNIFKNQHFNFSGPGARDPVLRAKIEISSQTAVSEREGRWFRLSSPLEQGLNVPRSFIYSHGFGLRAALFQQPNGAFNFTKGENPTLYLTLATNFPAGVCDVFAENYNVFRVLGGLAGPGFAT